MTTTTSTHCLQQNIAERYRRLIRSGKLRAGERLPTVRKIAEDMEISTTPVKIAFGLLEEEGLIYRRRGSGTYVGKLPSLLPRTLEIGVVFRPIHGWTKLDNYGLRLFEGIQDALKGGSYRTLLVTMSFEDGHPTNQEIPAQFVDQPAHGYILDEYMSDALVERFVATGRPVVVVNRPCELPGAAGVFRDDAQAGRITAEKVVSLGHHVAGCFYRMSNGGPQSYKAFTQRLAELGHAMDPSCAMQLETYIPRDSTYRQFAAMLSRKPSPTVIYMTDDRIVNMFYAWARERSVRIPEDISVVGKLDLTLATHLAPPLTTFRFDPAIIGSQAVHEVIRCCVESQLSPRSQSIEGEWVQRDSLVAPKQV